MWFDKKTGLIAGASGGIIFAVVFGIVILACSLSKDAVSIPGTEFIISLATGVILIAVLAAVMGGILGA